MQRNWPAEVGVHLSQGLQPPSIAPMFYCSKYPACKRWYATARVIFGLYQAINVFFYSGIGNLVDGLIFAKHIYLIISRAGWTGAKRKIEGGKIDLNPSLHPSAGSYIQGLGYPSGRNKSAGSCRLTQCDIRPPSGFSRRQGFRSESYLQMQIQDGHLVTLIPVAAILVASIKLHFLDFPLNLGYGGPHVIACGAQYRKGQELGWFEHGSTIIVFAPQNFTLCDNVLEARIIRAGQPLMLLP
jgi:Phosphatidylserine decarboxylase